MTLLPLLLGFGFIMSTNTVEVMRNEHYGLFGKVIRQVTKWLFAPP